MVLDCSFDSNLDVLQSHQACREWLKRHHRDIYDEYPSAGAGVVQMRIARFLSEQGIIDIYELDLVPPPGHSLTHVG